MVSSFHDAFGCRFYPKQPVPQQFSAVDSLRSEFPSAWMRACDAAVLPNYARLSLALWSPGALSVSPSAVRNSTFGKVPSRIVTSGGSGKTARRAESQLDQVGHRFPRKDPISAEHYATEKNA